ncbi:MAG TPA: hypothetical protein VFQ45_16535, partial [Longimicrobium sp.]|nr:hypothetical protein [Longimicrobium sp.]
ARDAVRAYLLGHLCHVAGDAICHPFIHDVEWHLGTSSRAKFDHGGGEMSIDAKVARQVMGRQHTREGQAWSAWWPGKREVPDELFAAYDAAMEEIYRAHGADRPKGFGGFEAELAHVDPLPLNTRFVKDGWSVLRGGAVGMVYGWGYGSWFGFLTPLMLSVMAIGPLAAALPRGRRMTQEAFWNVGDERAVFEYLALPLATMSFVPVFYGTWIAGLTTVGVEGITIFGQISAWINLVLAGVFFGTTALEEVHWAARWFLLFGLPLATGVVLLILAALNWKDRRGAAVLAALYGVPAALFFVFQILFWIPLVPVTAGLGAAAGDSGTGQAVGHWILSAILIVAAGYAWFTLPSFLRDVKLPEAPQPFPAERRHFVRLFDDTTLFHHLPLPAPAGAGPHPEQPTLAQRYFPPEARELLVLWYEGPGELYIRSRRTHLEFSRFPAGTSPFTVPAPVIPMTPAQFGEVLNVAVKGPADEPNVLKFELKHAADDELDVELTPGATFSDGGDRAERGADAAARAAEWTRVKTTKAEGFVLRHAPKAVQAVRWSKAGPIPFDPREDDEVAGPGTVGSAADDIDVTGANTDFRAFFVPGDRIRAAGQVRTVTLVPAADRLAVHSPFHPALPDGTAYARLGGEREPREGYLLVSDPGAAGLDGETVMDQAADFAALLCLGMTPHLLDREQLTVPRLAGKQKLDGTPADASVARVYQVFRNWSLDRRRVNEWRMIVAGGAVSEKSGHADGYDAAMKQPRPPAAAGDPDRWVPQPGLNETTLLQQGWVPLLRQWTARVARPQGAAGSFASAVDPAAPAAGVPSNRDLSQALAFLLDMPDPVVVRTP